MLWWKLWSLCSRFFIKFIKQWKRIVFDLIYYYLLNTAKETYKNCSLNFDNKGLGHIFYNSDETIPYLFNLSFPTIGEPSKFEMMTSEIDLDKRKMYLQELKCDKNKILENMKLNAKNDTVVSFWQNELDKINFQINKLNNRSKINSDVIKKTIEIQKEFCDNYLSQIGLSLDDFSINLSNDLEEERKLIKKTFYLGSRVIKYY